MSQTWEVIPVPFESALLDPRRRITTYTSDELDPYFVCPIDNSINNSCFHLPGVPNGPAPSD